VSYTNSGNYFKTSYKMCYKTALPGSLQYTFQLPKESLTIHWCKKYVKKSGTSAVHLGMNLVIKALHSCADTELCNYCTSWRMSSCTSLA